MEKHKLTDSWTTFINLISQTPTPQNEPSASLVKRYLEQNVEMLNEILLCSTETLKKLQQVKTDNEIICIQAKLTQDISKKLMSAAQQFLGASLSNVSDYNEWLKTHCDLATD